MAAGASIFATGVDFMELIRVAFRQISKALVTSRLGASGATIANLLRRSLWRLHGRKNMSVNAFKQPNALPLLSKDQRCS